MDDREIRGYSILAKGDTLQAVSKEEFLVPSQSGNHRYKVTHLDSWTCECKDFKYRKQICKHIHAIQFWLKLRDGIDANEVMIIEDIEDKGCPNCKSSNVVKNGVRKTKSGIRQRFLCKSCKKRFVIEPIKHIKGNAKIVTLAMDLYYKGLSLRDITDTVYQFYGLKLHHETIRRWIMKFTNAMNEYVNSLQPKVSGSWHIDEQNIKVKGKWLWSWNCIDEETRFQLANLITKTRYLKDARAMLRKVKESTDKKPEFIITDGLLAYRKAIKKEFHAHKNWLDRTTHIQMAALNQIPTNNLIERFHSTFRERDKVMRGFKAKHTAEQLSEGFRTYYNFIRPHMALKGLTPSEVANINLGLERNRWLGLLKKSIENNSV